MKSRCSLPTLAVVLAGLAGCASVTPPSAIPQAIERHSQAGQPTPAATAAGVRNGTAIREWWTVFGDPRLDALVRHAVERNHDLQAALASVRQARALAGLAQRDKLPVGSLGAQAQRGRSSLAEVDPYGQGLPTPPIRNLALIEQAVSWEIDLFGRIGTATAVAERQADMAEADAHAATAMLQAEVVQHYVLLRRHQQAWALVEDECTQLASRHDLMRARVAGGLADPRQIEAAQAELGKAQAERSYLAAAIERERAALAVLAGRSPVTDEEDWRALLAPGELPRLPETASLAQPTDLLANRPDVRRADAALRASLGEVVLAERAHLPRLSLSLVAGLSGRFGTLGSAGARRFSAGPALQWDWLTSGRLAAQEAAARAGSERAWHQFEQTVLRAIEDSETALRAWMAVCDAFEHARTAEAALREAARYTRARAAAGLEPATQDNEAAVASLRAERERLAMQGDALLGYARVQLALAAWQP